MKRETFDVTFAVLEDRGGVAVISSNPSLYGHPYYYFDGAHFQDNCSDRFCDQLPEEPGVYRMKMAAWDNDLDGWTFTIESKIDKVVTQLPDPKYRQEQVTTILVNMIREMDKEQRYSLVNQVLHQDGHPRHDDVMRVLKDVHDDIPGSMIEVGELFLNPTTIEIKRYETTKSRRHR